MEYAYIYFESICNLNKCINTNIKQMQKKKKKMKENIDFPDTLKYHHKYNSKSLALNWQGAE